MDIYAFMENLKSYLKFKNLQLHFFKRVSINFV